MRSTLFLLFTVALAGCGGSADRGTDVDNPGNAFSTFDQSRQLLPEVDRERFNALHSWEFAWAIVEPLTLAADKAPEDAFSERLSPGQKALYYFWLLDGEVTNGGFIQFYWNEHRKYLAPVKKGLELVDDPKLLELVEKADRFYLAHEDQFRVQRKLDDWEPLYKGLKEFDQLDAKYYGLRDSAVAGIERYVRAHPGDFVKIR